MKQVPSGWIKGEIVNAFQEEDLSSKLFLLAQDIANEDAKKNTDAGTCVLGNGIGVWFLEKGKRIARRMIIIHGPFQGNISNYKSLERALDFLKSNNVQCFYEDGHID